MGIRQPVPPSVDLDLDGIPDDTLLRKGPGNTIISSLAKQEGEGLLVVDGSGEFSPSSVRTGNISQGTCNRVLQYERTNSDNEPIEKVTKFFQVAQRYGGFGSERPTDFAPLGGGEVILFDDQSTAGYIPPLEFVGVTGNNELRQAFIAIPAQAGAGIFTFEERLDGPAGDLLIKVEFEMTITADMVGRKYRIELGPGEATSKDTVRWSRSVFPPIKFFGQDLGGGYVLPWIAEYLAIWREYSLLRDPRTGDFRHPNAILSIPALPETVVAPYTLPATAIVAWTFDGQGFEDGVRHSAQGTIKQDGALLASPYPADFSALVTLNPLTLNAGDVMEIEVEFRSSRQTRVIGKLSVRALAPADLPRDIEMGYAPENTPISAALIGALTNGSTLARDLPDIGDVCSMTPPAGNQRFIMLVPSARGQVEYIDDIGSQTTPGVDASYVAGYERVRVYSLTHPAEKKALLNSEVVIDALGVPYVAVYTRKKVNSSWPGTCLRATSLPPLVHNPSSTAALPLLGPVAGWAAGDSSPSYVATDIQEGRVVGVGAVGTVVGQLVDLPGAYLALFAYSALDSVTSDPVDGAAARIGTVTGDYTPALATQALGEYVEGYGWDQSDGLIRSGGVTETVSGGLPQLPPNVVLEGADLALAVVLDEEGVRVWAGRVEDRGITWIGGGDPYGEEVPTWRHPGATSFRFAFGDADATADVGFRFWTWRERAIRTTPTYTDVEEAL